MEKRKLNIVWNKSGSGSYSTRITIPISWIKEMGLDNQNRKVEVTFNKKNKEIKIKKYDEK